jgi:hypothetical protein
MDMDNILEKANEVMDKAKIAQAFPKFSISKKRGDKPVIKVESGNPKLTIEIYKQFAELCNKNGIGERRK